MANVQMEIDGRSIRTGEGQTVLQAAREHGIYIPTLCYDERLEPFGACRMCLGKSAGSPRR